MSSPILTRFRETTAAAGKAGMAALFPNEFEAYILTLELVDSRGTITDYFSFPVLPDDMTKTEAEITNIKKTLGGVISLTTNTFTPQDIIINGNFGRSFKVLIGQELVDFKAFGADIKTVAGGGLQGLTNPFDVKIKTGFGCTKILQHIVGKSVALDDYNKPHKLFFHNPTLGESYLVEKMSLSLRQDKNTSNAMWGYSLSFKILSPANLLGTQGQTSLLKTLGIGVLQQEINRISRDCSGIIKDSASTPVTTIFDTFKAGLKNTNFSINKGIITG